VLTLTDSAANVIHELSSQPGMAAGTGLRIAANTQDTTGPAYAASLSPGPDPQDHVIATGEARVYVGPEVAGQLDDKLLDAQIDDQGAVAFLVVPRPSTTT